MKRRRIARLRWLLMAVLLPPAFWGLILAAVPTEWARRQVEDALSEAVGHPCRLDALSLGPLGDVRLRGVEMAVPGREHDPWLRAELVRIDVRLLQLIHGQLQPTNVHADGLTLRVRREVGGAFEFEDLLRTDPTRPVATQAAGNVCDLDELEVTFRLTNSRFAIVDEPTATRLDMDQLNGRGTWRRCRATITGLTGRINGGTFLLDAELDRGAGSPMFEGELHARQVALGEGMDVLGYVAPVLAGASNAMDGRMDLNLYLRGQGTTAGELGRSLVGQGAIRLDPIRLDHSHLFAELGRILTLPSQGSLGSIRSDFGIANRRVLTKDMTVEVAGVPVVFAGWTDFDGQVDYRIRSEPLTERYAPEIRDVFRDVPFGLDDLMELRVQGRPGALVLTLNGVPIGVDGRPMSAPDHLRQISRRLRDRILR